MANWKDTDNFFNLMQDVEKNLVNSGGEKRQSSSERTYQRRNIGAVPKQIKLQCNNLKGNELIGVSLSNRTLQNKAARVNSGNHSLPRNEKSNNASSQEKVLLANSNKSLQNNPVNSGGEKRQSSSERTYQRRNTGAVPKQIKLQCNNPKGNELMGVSLPNRTLQNKAARVKFGNRSLPRNEKSNDPANQQKDLSFTSKGTLLNTYSQENPGSHDLFRNDRRNGDKGSLCEENYRFKAMQNEKSNWNKHYTEIQYPSTSSDLARNNIQKFTTEFHSQKFDTKSSKTSNEVQRSNIHSQEGNRRSFGYRRLLELSEKEISDIVVTVANPRSRFQTLFEEELSPDFIFLTMAVIGKLCNSHFVQAKNSILSSASNPTFLEQITMFIGELPTKNYYSEERIRKIDSFVNNILTFLAALIDILPTTAYERIKRVIVALSISVEGMQSNINFSEETFVDLENISTTFFALEAEKKNQLMKGNTGPRSNFLKPPDDFRHISIIPTFKDIFTPSKDVYLRQNIVKGAYEDVDHYLDVQFRLLREDFVGPLREGIQEYIKYPDKKTKINNIRVYPNVIFLQGVRNKNKCGYEIFFDSSGRFKKVNWEYSKRFMYGSLLLFTKDNFKTFFLATVSERSTYKLKDGLITIEVIQGTELPANLFTEEYLMVESEVYFEPYFHVLKALQNIERETFPMEDYIVYVDADSNLPKYFTKTNYNWDIFDFCVDVLDENSWPSSNDLKLDPSQYTAFQAALTNEFVAIQGPPGTGKTHIGLMIAEVLLRNLKNVPSFGPLLVICYTNHALDQFLEGLLPHTNNIIRIGGQSRSEVLKDFNITEVRKRSDRNDYGEINQACRNLRYAMNDVLEGMTILESSIQELGNFNGILSVEKIKNFMTPNQRDMLLDSNLFENWLTEEAYLKVISPDRISASYNKLSHSQVHSESKTIEFIPTSSTAEQMITTSTMSSNNPDEKHSPILVVDSDESEEDEEHFNRLKNLINIYEFDDEIEPTAIDDENNPTLYVANLEKLKTDLIFHKEKLENLINQGSAHITPIEIQSQYDDLCELNIYYEYVNTRLEGIRNISIYDPQNIDNDDVWQLDYNDRWNLYRWWVEKYIISLKSDIQELEIKYRELKLQFEEVKQVEDLKFVSKADVVGITTTGAARLRSLLNKLKAKIVIVEEAAEVLEAHIVTSITKDCQHVILIGDHEQLRPSTAVFKLAKHYNMDISLFERMLRNGLGCYKLGVQHRMRPEIASLIVPAIYKELANHPSVEGRPNIKGITHNVFFISHTQLEDEVPDSASRRNKHEADFLIALCRHLLLQGYTANEITILTTYSGQMQYMIKEKRKNALLREVRIIVVDKYQGEENRIILLSLVRSNKLGKIGFLSTKNRVCVALSRAKDGLYIIGNMSNLEEGSTIWQDIKRQLGKGNEIGPDLTLRCEIHQNYLTRVRQASDFVKVPQGGCDQICEEELVCGHRCTSTCHIIDREHLFLKCKFPCNREICSIEGHDCPKLCWERCDECKKPVKKDLPCGHSAVLQCYKNPEEEKCIVMMDAVLPVCGHKITKPCYVNINTFHCSHPCEDRLPCGHKCEKKCHKLNDPDHLEYKCMKNCERNDMKCTNNHKCQKWCYEDCGECTYEVQKKLSCGHFETTMCSVDVNSIICLKPCKKKLPCGHPCKLDCYKECGGCRQLVTKILSDCKHSQNKVACSDEPDPKKCSQPCNRTLKCGHLCKRKCNQVCNAIKCLEIIKTPILSPCGHQVTDYECYMADEPEELCLYCKSPCRKTLSCGHVCQGDCSSCIVLSKRSTHVIHAPCKEKCEKKLVCGHTCNALCREICPPCNQKCLYECNHRSCTKPCGEMCDPCNMKCDRRCEHLTCTKRCSEICNITQCNENCTIYLPCMDRCKGLCGENCPKCFRCTNLMEPPITTRYLKLEDCECEIEVNILDRMFLSPSSDRMFLSPGSLIEHKCCPRCKVPIIKTKRYKMKILQTFRDIGHIKRKIFSHFEENIKRSKTLLKELEVLLQTGNSDMPELLNNFGKLLKESLDRIIFVKRQPTKHYALIVIAGFFCNLIKFSPNNMLRGFIRVFEQRLEYINLDDIDKIRNLFLYLDINTSLPLESLRYINFCKGVWQQCKKCKYVISSYENRALECYNCDKLQQEVTRNVDETNSLLKHTTGGRNRSRGGRGGKRGGRGRGRDWYKNTNW